MFQYVKVDDETRRVFLLSLRRYRDSLVDAQCGSLLQKLLVNSDLELVERMIGNLENDKCNQLIKPALPSIPAGTTPSMNLKHELLQLKLKGGNKAFTVLGNNGVVMVKYDKDSEAFLIEENLRIVLKTEHLTEAAAKINKLIPTPLKRRKDLDIDGV